MPGDTSRAEVAQALAEQFGAPISAALMEVIPPFGWHEIATRGDLARLEQKVDARFDAVDARFAAVEARFDAMEARLDARFLGVDAKFLGVDARFDAIDARLLGVDARFDAIDARFDAVDARFDVLRSDLTAAFHAERTRLIRWMVGAMIATVASGAALVSAVAALQ